MGWGESGNIVVVPLQGRPSRPEFDSMASAADHQNATSRHELRPRWKRWLFRAIALLLSLAVLEILAWLGLYVFRGTVSLEQIHSEQYAIAHSQFEEGTAGEAIHPYLGWVLNPQTNPGLVINGRRIPVNSLGFHDDGRPLPRRDRDRLIVAVLGGSVAWQMTAYSDEALRTTLAERPEARGRTIEIVRLALSGYKQPQQLMTLNYMLALGAEFDVVVNIDGFNEIALPVAENDKSGVFVAYPRSWHTRMSQLVDPRDYDTAYRLLELRARRKARATALLESPLRWSALRNSFWILLDEYDRRQVVELGISLFQKDDRQGRGFDADGPPQPYETENEMYAELVRIWTECSIQLDHLCRANGITYIHVLQPNQYLRESKSMSPAEAKVAIAETEAFGKAVERGYPLLIRAGEDLARRGLHYHDLTMLFADIDEPIYVDHCCHYNQRGYDLLATEVARIIAAALPQ